MYMPVEHISRLKVLLMESDLPAYQIAAKLGIHPSTLSTYALGQVQPSTRHLRALCRYFKVTQQELLGWETVNIGGPDD